MTEQDETLVGRAAQDKANQLEELVTDSRTWTVLYRDPVTGDLWKESYPWPEAHAGGPPRLERISHERALHEFDVTEEELS